MSIPLFTYDMRKYIHDDIVEYMHILPYDLSTIEMWIGCIKESEIKIKAMEDNIGKFRDDERFDIIIKDEFLLKLGRSTISCSLGDSINGLSNNINQYKRQFAHAKKIINMYKDIEIIKSNQVRITSICEHLENKIADNEQNLNVALDEIKKEVKFYRFMIVGLIIFYSLLILKPFHPVLLS